MFDPHRTRRSDRRYYTRKGQVIQASRVDVQPIIDQRLVPVYKKFLIANGLAYDSPQPSPPSPVIQLDGIGISVNNVSFPFTLMTLSTEPTIDVTIHGSSQAPTFAAAFYQDTSGNYNFKIVTVPANITSTGIHIENNAKCYIVHVGMFDMITNPNSFSAAYKGVYSFDRYIAVVKCNDFTLSAHDIQIRFD
uniref:Cap n=1 Tax=Po-Circo-like virus TaxID=1454552 RepID=A0A8F9U9J9_9VIRU|nr:Cap [Po-Circo-like virus]